MEKPTSPIFDANVPRIRQLLQRAFQANDQAGIGVNAVAPGPFWTALQVSGGQTIYHYTTCL
jgi:hypothetical protein